MAEFKCRRYRRKAEIDRQSRFAPIPDYQKSILEMRRIYHDMPLERFAKMYQSKYGVKMATVIKFIQQEEEKNAERTTN